MTLIVPVSGRFTDAYGPRGYVPGIGNLGFHTGQDIAAAAGTPIYAAHNGVVTRKWWDKYANGQGAGGWMIETRGDDGVTVRCAHMQDASPLAIGQRVYAGQTVVGLVGATGAATGPHLHFEVLVGGQFVDPLPYLNGSLGDDDMTPDQSMKLDAVYAALFGPVNVGGKQLSWASVDGDRAAAYGVLDIDIHTQSLVAQLVGQVSALTAAVQTLPGGGAVDMARLEEAAERGARDALSGLVLKADG